MSSVFIRQTPHPIDLCSMCPGMDLAAVSFLVPTNNNNNTFNSTVYVFRTRPEQQLNAVEEESENDDGNDRADENENQASEDASSSAKTAADSKTNSNNTSANAPPIFTYSIKDSSSPVISLQWAPAGGRLLAVSTATEIHIVHVELQALLRVHHVQPSTTINAPALLRHSLLPPARDGDGNTQSSSPRILASTWSRLPLLDSDIGGTFPCSRILYAENNGITASSSSSSSSSGGASSAFSSSTACQSINNNGDVDDQATFAASCGFSPQLLELAEAEWQQQQPQGAGCASILMVALSNGQISILLGGLTQFALLGSSSNDLVSAAALKNNSPKCTLFLGSLHRTRQEKQFVNNNNNSTLLLDAFLQVSSDSADTQILHIPIVPSLPSSSPTGGVLSPSIAGHCISLAARLVCQSRELLIKLRADLADAHRYWTTHVDKILDKAMPQIIWNYRSEVAASMINGQMIRRLMERKELDQSTVVAAGEILRDASATIMKTITDIVMECIAVVGEHAAIIDATSANKNMDNTSLLNRISAAQIVAALRDEVSIWAKQVALERELLSCVLRWLHHYIGSIRAAIIFEEELQQRQDGGSNHPPPSPPPAISHIDPSDFLVVFDFLTASVLVPSDETTKPSIPSAIRNHLNNAAKSVQDHVGILLEKFIVSVADIHSSSSASSASSSTTTTTTSGSLWKKPHPIQMQSFTSLATSCTSFTYSNNSNNGPVSLHYVFNNEDMMLMMNSSNDTSGNVVIRFVDLPSILNIPQSEDDGTKRDVYDLSLDFQPSIDCAEIFVACCTDDNSAGGNSNAAVVVKRICLEEFNQKKQHDTATRIATFQTEFAPPPPTSNSADCANANANNNNNKIRLFPNAQRDTLGVVKGKRIQFVDVSIEDDDIADDDNDEDNNNEN